MAQVLSIDTIEFRRANDASARHAFIVAQGTDFFYPVLDYKGATDAEITIEAVVQHASTARPRAASSSASTAASSATRNCGMRSPSTPPSQRRRDAVPVSRNPPLVVDTRSRV